MSKKWYEHHLQEQQLEQQETRREQLRNLYGFPKLESDKPIEPEGSFTSDGKTITWTFNVVGQTLSGKSYGWDFVQNLSGVNVTFHSYSTWDKTYSVPPEPKEPVTEQEEIPILAQRYAGLGLFGSKLMFTSIGLGHGRFGVHADAVCKKSESDWVRHGHKWSKAEHHKAPSWDCSCGFYAVPSDKLPKPMGCENRIILQVELSGLVVIHDEGYRAEHQRVLEIKVPDCYCGKPAEFFALSERSNRLLDITCMEHFHINVPTEEWAQFRREVTAEAWNRFNVAVERVTPISLDQVAAMTGVAVNRYEA